MLLAVDIGNSFTKLGVYDGEILVRKLSFPTNKNEFFSSSNFSAIDESIDAAIVCSVVPEINERVAFVIRERFDIDPQLVSNKLDFGFEILHSPINTIGTDRLVNVFAAIEKFGANTVVCSIGTALTIDFVDASRVLRGGVIAPGIQLLAAALHDASSQLPEVEIAATGKVLQQSTVAAVQSGVVNGFFGMFETLLSKVRSEASSSCRVIATGGSAAFVAQNVRGIDFIDENLLLDGLQRLHARTTPHPANA